MRTFGSLKLHDDRWVMADVEPHVCIRLKQIFPRVPKTQGPPFVFSADLGTAADLDWFVTRYPLALTKADREALRRARRRYEATQVELEQILAPDYVPPSRVGLKPDAELRVYQAQVADVLLHAHGLLLGDEVGLGKTYAACGAFLNPGALPAVAVCYAHLQKQWRGVVEGFTSLTAHMIKGTQPYTLPGADVYIFRWSQIAGWHDAIPLLGVRTVAYDEVQELRTGTKSMKGQAAWALSGAATFKIGLSATPIYNYGSEIWQIMQYLRRDVLGPYDDFYREWTSRGSIRNPEALGSFLREQHAFLRRTKRDVGKDMPPVNRIVENIAYDEKSVRSIDDIAHALAIRASSGQFIERGQAARELDMLVRKQTGVAKAKFVADFARMVVASGEPVVLAGWHRDVYEIWNERLADLQPVMYTGSESPAAKARSLDAFVAGETDVFIMSLRSGAGLNGLERRASTIIFGELDWSPGVHHQCIGRLDREGQDNYPVTAIFLVTDEGSDPPMIEVLGIKAAEASAIIDPGLGVQHVYTDETHIQKLVARYLEKRGRASSEQLDMQQGADDA